jgi:hypothetical protein
MRRTSFAGALLVIAVGAVLAFAVQDSPRDLDLQAAGVILILGGAADLVIRSLIADSPLLSSQSADVAAVVEPVGEPVLNAAGNPIAVANPSAAGQTRPPLVAPLPGTMPPGAAAETLVVTDEYGVTRLPPDAAPWSAAPESAALPQPQPPVASSGGGVPGFDEVAYGAAVRAATGDPLDTPESPVAVTTLTGRPVRPRGRGRGFRRGRRR